MAVVDRPHQCPIGTPDTHGLEKTGRQVAPVVAPGDLFHAGFGVVVEGSGFALCWIPQPNGPIVPAAGQSPAVRGPGQGADLPVVPAQYGGQPAIGAPDPNFRGAAAGQLARSAPGQAPDSPAVAQQQADQAQRAVPDLVNSHL